MLMGFKVIELYMSQGMGSEAIPFFMVLCSCADGDESEFTDDGFRVCACDSRQTALGDSATHQLENDRVELTPFLFVIDMKGGARELAAALFAAKAGDVPAIRSPGEGSFSDDWSGKTIRIGRQACGIRANSFHGGLKSSNYARNQRMRMELMPTERGQLEVTKQT